MVRASLMLILTVLPSALAASAPPPGLFEYLGAMVESHGQLIDPLALEAVVEEIALESSATLETETESETGHDDTAADARLEQPAISEEKDR